MSEQDKTDRGTGEIKRHFGATGMTGTSTEIIDTQMTPPRPAKYSELLIAHSDRASTVTEEFRAVRSQLLATAPDGRFGIFVTSADAGEGKTVMCGNLAMVLAERAEAKTVLVDGNLRNGRMSDMLNAPAQPGVVELLHGQATLEQVTQPTAYPNLVYIPSGKISDGPGSQLMAPQLSAVVADLRRQYDHVLFDTPAVQASPDAGIVGATGLQALVVVRMYRTRREAVARTLRALGGSNVGVAGIVLNERKFFIPSAVYRAV